MWTGNVKERVFGKELEFSVKHVYRLLYCRAYICCLCTVRRWHCQYPAFVIITIDMLMNSYLMVHVYASSPPQNNYIHSKFILLYQVTFNEAMYPFNSNGKMWPVHRASDMLYLVFKYLWCFNKLKMKACIVCEIARALNHAYLRPESIHRQIKLVVGIDLHCCFP